MIGFLWYKLSPYVINSKSSKCNNDIVYEDTNKPRADDLVFNLSGQVLYYLYIVINKNYL